MELPRALVETERAFALGNHILDERGELEQALGLLGLGARCLQLLLELVDCLRPIARPTQAFPKQRTRIHLRSILPQTPKENPALIVRGLYITAVHACVASAGANFTES